MLLLANMVEAVVDLQAVHKLQNMLSQIIIMVLIVIKWVVAL
jgi:hypothetical protein